MTAALTTAPGDTAVLDEDDPFALTIEIDEPAAGNEPTAWWCTHRYSCRWTKCCSGKMTQVVAPDYWL